MTYAQFIEEIKTIVEAYQGTPTLNFKYDRVWGVNGEISLGFPLCLVESQPNFTPSLLSENLKASKMEYEGKIFFFDTYKQGERATKTLYEKQSELNEVALKITAEIGTRMRDLKKTQVKFGGGFFGVDVHNAKLIEVYMPFTVTLPMNCDLGEFDYE
jgi:hypothetical protein